MSPGQWSVISCSKMRKEKTRFASSASLPWCRASTDEGNGVPAFPQSDSRSEWCSTQSFTNYHPTLFHSWGWKGDVTIVNQVELEWAFSHTNWDWNITPVPEDLKDPSNWNIWNPWSLSPPSCVPWGPTGALLAVISCQLSGTRIKELYRGCTQFWFKFNLCGQLFV